ncbi:TPA: TraY domain-containing protein [Klebsiella pneumoniae subsp. pneumoniae]|nr:TraY domain-containing protein [Klebsiella pneumoniae subsp. pneumoniae]
MSKRYTSTGNKNIVSVYLDDDTHALLVSAKNRSGRTKSTEVALQAGARTVLSWNQSQFGDW